MDDAEIPTTYTAAAAELDSILQRLERDDVDVDRLVADVARGGHSQELQLGGDGAPLGAVLL